MPVISVDTMTKATKILIADDHQILLDGMKAILTEEANFKIVGEAHNGKEVLEVLKGSDADVLIMDINMPEMDGIEALKAIEKLNTDLKIIILSSYDDLRLIKEVLKAGASGYLTKNSAAESIIDAVETVVKGEQYFDSAIQKKIIGAFPGAGSKGKERTTEGVLPVSLTNRERDILRLIAQEYSSKEIGKQLFISVNTVETHRKNLIRKLKVRNSIGLAKFAIQHGFT